MLYSRGPVKAVVTFKQLECKAGLYESPVKIIVMYGMHGMLALTDE